MTTGRETIIVVDDSEMIREIVSRRLKKEGYEVLTAEGGRQAIEIIQKGEVDLVLLDIFMPALDGFEVLKILRKSYSAARLPIIMVTALSAGEDVRKALELGASDYLTKPIDFPLAIGRIRMHLERKRAEVMLRESLERYALAARGANDGLWDLDLRNNLLYVSPRWKSALGYEDTEIGTDPTEWFGRVHQEDVARLKADLQAHIDGATPHLESEYRIRDRAGEYRWMLARGIVARNGSNRPCRVSGSQTDIARAKIADALTGLPTKLLLLDQLKWCVERARRYSNYSFAVIFLDLDGFKSINDSLGQMMGDQLLIGIARRLQSCLRSVDLVARLGGGHTVARPGGDEFTILIDNVLSVGETTTVVERIKAELSKPFNLRGREVLTTASMGIALSNPSYERAEDILRDADIAMSRAKVRGKSSFVIFDAGMSNPNPGPTVPPQI